MKKTIFLGPVDKFAKLMVFALQKRESVLWITDNFSVYAYENVIRHLNNTKLCNYCDSEIIHTFTDNIGECIIWYYAKETREDIYIDFIRRYSKIFICKVKLVICNSIFLKRKSVSDMKLFDGMQENNIQIFIVPDIAKSGNNNIIEDILYQIYQFQKMILRRGYSLYEHPIAIDVENKWLYFIPLDDVVRAIIYLEKEEKQVNYIFDKRTEFSIEEIFAIFNNVNGYRQFVCEKTQSSENLINNIFEEVFLSYFPNLEWEFYLASAISDIYVCPKCWLQKRIERYIIKMSVLPSNVKLMEKSIKSVYEKNGLLCD